MYNRLVMSVIAVPVLVFWYQGMWMVFERSSMEEALRRALLLGSSCRMRPLRGDGSRLA